jgi:hypothetical protein
MSEVRRLWPKCAICGKPVDEMVSWCSAASKDLTIIVRCHGDIDTTVIPAAVLFDVPPEDWGPGTAFSEKRAIKLTKQKEGGVDGKPNTALS